LIQSAIPADGERPGRGSVAALKQVLVDLGARRTDKVEVLRTGGREPICFCPPVERLQDPGQALGLKGPTLISVGALIERKGHHRDDRGANAPASRVRTAVSKGLVTILALWLCLRHEPSFSAKPASTGYRTFTTQRAFPTRAEPLIRDLSERGTNSPEVIGDRLPCDFAGCRRR